MSKILFWYGKDFGHSDEVKLRWISNYLEVDKKDKLVALLGRGERREDNKEGYTIEYSDYNWTVNSK